MITRVVDRADTVRSHVYVPLYPLAESLVTNWWFLLHEIENPVKADDPAFRRRHALVSARDGYAFPNLQVMPSGGRMHLAWMADRLQWSQIEFLNEGQAWIDRDEFRNCCSDLVGRVVQRLASLGVEGTFLHAAEFLAPSAALRRRVSRSTLDEDGVDELAAEFGVSSMLIAHQVQNHGIAQIG